MILRDHIHFSPDETGVCAHCGQPLPVAAAVPRYGDKRTSRTGIIVTIVLHLLLVLIYLLQPKLEKHAPPPSGGEIVYLAPLPGKPSPKKQEQQTPKKVQKTAPPKVQIQRLPNTITLPDEKPVPVVEQPKPVAEPPKEVDMAAYVEARRKARGASTVEQPAEESENDRATRIAKANIAAANGRSRGDDRNETGGVFSISNQTFHSA